MSREYVTLKEIYQQPEMWKKTFEIIKAQKEKIYNFINFYKITFSHDLLNFYDFPNFYEVSLFYKIINFY